MDKTQQDKLKNILIRKGIGGLTLIDYLGLKDYNRVRNILLDLSYNGDIFLPINIVENIWSKTEDKGWGNGYVDVPSRHPCFNMSPEDIKTRYKGDIIEKISYSDLSENGWWRIGFDSLGEPQTNKDKVLEMTLNLLIELYILR
tara:strand:- start:653 stop:1084 length:432 start_codon:yes stop_codon:yes gene_type:complete